MPKLYHCIRSLKPVCTFVAVGFILAAASEASADVGEDFIAAQKVFVEGDYKAALRELEPLLQTGDERAAYLARLARMILKLRGIAEDLGTSGSTVDLRDYWGRYSIVRSKSDEERFEAGMRAYDAEDYSAAHSAWLPLAEAGDAVAQERVASLYAAGQGIEKDRARAEKYLRLSAEQGYPRAQTRLVYLIDLFGLSEDKAVKRETFNLVMRAAANGNVEGYAFLSRAYCYGEGTDKNPVLSDIWNYIALPLDEEAFMKQRCERYATKPPGYYAEIRRRALAMMEAYDLQAIPID